MLDLLRRIDALQLPDISQAVMHTVLNKEGAAVQSANVTLLRSQRNLPTTNPIMTTTNTHSNPLQQSPNPTATRRRITGKRKPESSAAALPRLAACQLTTSSHSQVDAASVAKKPRLLYQLCGVDKPSPTQSPTATPDQEVLRLETNPDDNTPAARFLAAQAAEERKVQLKHRGIGNLKTFKERHNPVSQNDEFGRANKEKLRARIKASQRKSTNSKASSAAPATSSIAPGDPAPSAQRTVPRYSYSSTLVSVPATQDLQRWALSVAPANTLPLHRDIVSTQDAGGEGDCFFHSVGAALETMLVSNETGAKDFVLRNVNEADFQSGKEYIVQRLRSKVAQRVVHDVTNEEFLNFCLSNLHQHQADPEAWFDGWNPVHLLQNNGFHDLLRANRVSAVGSTEHTASTDLVVICEFETGERRFLIHTGYPNLQQLRMDLGGIFEQCGNMHWATPTDIVALSEALTLGIIILCDVPQGNGSHVYGYNARRADYEWWILLYNQRAHHFRLASWYVANDTTARCFFHRSRIPPELTTAFNNANTNVHIGQADRGGFS